MLVHSGFAWVVISHENTVYFTRVRLYTERFGLSVLGKGNVYEVLAFLVGGVIDDDDAAPIAVGGSEGSGGFGVGDRRGHSVVAWEGWLIAAQAG